MAQRGRDGSSRRTAVKRVVFLAIFVVTLAIQEFVGVPVALVRGDVYCWGSLMAACLVTSIPIAIVYNFFLDRFIAGFTVGAIK